MKNTLSTLLFLFVAFNLITNKSSAQVSWPIVFESKSGFVTTMYQPQLESFKANVLEGRMAVTIKPKDEDMVFGAIWFKAQMSTDIENRTVVLENLNIIKTHFPEMVNEEKSKKFSNFLSSELESWNIKMSLDRILASLDEVESIKQLSDNINNDAPTIYFRTTPAVMILIDGEPILKKDESIGLEYVVNTPFFIVKDIAKNDYYINGGKFWYTSKQILSGWKESKEVPLKVREFAEKNIVENKTDSTAQSYTEFPELIIETKAAELILVDGEVDYKPIDSTTLLYVSNTESDIIMDINSQNHYLLLAGRWYKSKLLQNGNWTFCEPDNLPTEFKKIPDESEMVSVKSSIPGTDEAQIALLEQSIPQTATIDRMQAKVEVKYDGDPQFEKIEGTDVSYAVNTDKTVLLINKVYYCIDNAVWFMANSATGSWDICVTRPDEVDQIPPESPVYNVKYSYIYESTPEVVYVGYLPGYTNSYVYNGTVVYGTGYYYNPWYVNYYYPRPVTWGYGVHYSPYRGWGFSAGISFGWIGWGFHPYGRAYWGPRGYHHGYRRGYHHGYRHGYNRGARAGYAAGSRNANRNVYNNRNSGVRQTGNNKNTRPSNSINNKARPSTGKANNMYSDRKGNVYQRDQKGNYQNKSNRQGQQHNKQTKPNNTQRNQQLDRSHQSRNQGNHNHNRSQQYNRSPSRSSMPSGARGGGGGGGRRR